MKFEEVKAVVNANKPPKMPIYDYVAYYNAIVKNENQKLVCVSTDSYVLDSFYTKSELIERLCVELATETERITELFDKIGGDDFDVPSVYTLIRKLLLA